MQTGNLLEIVPPRGSRAIRLEFARWHLTLALIFCVALFGAIGSFGVATVRLAEGRASQLRSISDEQSRRLKSIDAQAAALDRELHALRTQNEQIRRLLGDGRGASHARHAIRGKVAAVRASATGRRSLRTDGNSFAQVSARIERLRSDSASARSDGTRLERVALRVLNMRRLERIARARVLAAIPSVNPAGTAGIASAFGWRVVPWPEFHAGVDLDANYAEDVRAGAAGTVVTAGYDGGYGIKVDIDHGNGYHTWYCHLSRADVRAGQYVRKAEHIALVGSTGASTGPHLHYQIMLDGHAIDPVPYLAGVPKRVLASLK